MTTDLDLVALRPTDASIDAEFSPARRAAILQTVLSTSVDAPVDPSTETPVDLGAKRRRPRRTVLLVAAGLAAVVASGGVLGDVSSRLPSRLSPIVAQPAAADTLDQVAARAARQRPVPALEPGQYRAVVSVDQQSDAAPITHESYVAADGWTWRRDTENLNHTWFLYPTTDELDPATLPIDPDQLELALRRVATGTESDEESLFKEIGELALTENAPPAVRAAAITVLTHLAERPVRTIPGRKGASTTPAVTVFRGELGGRTVIGTQCSDADRPGLRFTYWFDAATSELVRTDQTSSDGSTFSHEVRSRTTVDQLPDQIVDKLGTQRIQKIVK